MQGFGPAIIIRELLIRTSPLAPGKWLFTIVLFTVLGISATYELIEWWTALASEEASAAFLGTQGDVWDTQWDMFLAGCGAIAAQFVFERAARPAARRGRSGDRRQGGASGVSPEARRPPTYRWARRIAVAIVGGTVLASASR